MQLDKETIEEHKTETFKRLRSEESMEGDEHGRVTLMDERFNIMGADYFMASILEMLSDLYGQGAGGILRETGESYGEDLLALCQPAEDDSDQACLGQFLGALAFLGYSDPEATGDAIRFPSSPTAEEYRKKEDAEDRKTCYFLAGILTGAAQDIGLSVRFNEEQCKAAGDDACVFNLEDVDTA